MSKPELRAGDDALGEAELRAAMLAFSVEPALAPLVAGLGRIEDAALSPDGRLLALPEYAHERVHVVELRDEGAGPARRIRLTRAVTLTSPSFSAPHGVEFLGAGLLAVANRTGGIGVYRVPRLADGAPASHAVRPKLFIPGGEAGAVRMPGSLAAVPEGDGVWRLYVCNNYIHTITRHRIRLRGLSGIVPLDSRRRVTHEGVFVDAGRGVNIPDGVAVAPDGDVVAVSSHATGEILIFDADGAADAPARAVLGGMVCPHGLHFTPDGAWLHVADAGTPYLHSYRRGEDGAWSSAPVPARSVRIVDAETFERGHFNPLEGGIKGIEIDARSGLVVMVCEEQPLAFFDVGALFELPARSIGNEVAHGAAARDAAVRRTEEWMARRARRRAARRRA